MKYCPICERNYHDATQLCEMDGATLKLIGKKQDPYVGNTIKGRYNVISKIGEGGMGSVYLAEQVSVGRKVALKLLQGTYASDDEFIGRFRREARLAASLNHRNIVTIYDFDQGNDESLFIAMEYLHGKKLSDLIRQEGPLSIGRAVRLGVQIAEGLAAAHHVGVIHRDIKPDNIMVVGEPALEEIKLMDFGIARMMDAGTMSNLTRPGVIMGTPAYMAPEQAEGGEIDEKTDIYALGIVLYEMLSGSVPFKATTPSAVLIKQIRETPIQLRKVRKEVPAVIEATIMQMLEKKPQKRQKDMREVVQGLQKIDATMIIDQTPKTMAQTMVLKPERTEKLQALKANKLLWAGLVGVTLLLVALLAMFWRRGPAESEIVALAIQGKRELRVGETAVLVVEGRHADGSATKIRNNLQWQSSDNSVISVKSDGEVQGLKDGFADITARYQDKPSASLTLVVRGLPQPVPEPKRSISAEIEDHIKTANSLSERGDYSMALQELQKAKSLDAKNKSILAEIQRTRNACLAEKRQGTTNSSCN